MLKSLRRYILIIALIFITPILFFSVYEIGTLRENEKVIENIYKNQLDAILFSVNQYSDDVLSSWADLIESCISLDSTYQDSCLKQTIPRLPSTCQLFQYRVEGRELTSLGEYGKNLMPLEDMREKLSSQDTLFSKVAMYFKGGYRKIEILPLDSRSFGLFFYSKASGKGSFIIMVLDPERFIKEVLDPRIQQVAREEFYISALQNNNDSLIYISDHTQRSVEPEYTKEFWLLPQYSMGITLRDSKISDLVRERSRKNLFMIGIIDFILLFGVWLIYRNVKKQVELTQLKSDFVSNVSHEIRTPLALISMYIETLEMGRINSKQKIKEYYQVILQETQRLTTIVNKILSFSHIESGQRSYSKEKTELNDIVRTVLDSYSIRMKKDGFECAQKLQEELPTIIADKEAVADAIINLIDNAMKYSDQDRFIEVETFQKGTTLILAVSDRGIGISQDEQKYIFEKFYRVTEKDLALRSKGSGLGLPIVKHIMNSHGGKINIESTKGKGSRFELHFPIKSIQADPSKIKT